MQTTRTTQIYNNLSRLFLATYPWFHNGVFTAVVIVSPVIAAVTVAVATFVFVFLFMLTLLFSKIEWKCLTRVEKRHVCGKSWRNKVNFLMLILIQSKHRTGCDINVVLWGMSYSQQQRRLMSRMRVIIPQIADQNCRLNRFSGREFCSRKPMFFQKKVNRSPGPVTGRSGLCDLIGSFRSASFTFFLLRNRFSRNIGRECALEKKCKIVNALSWKIWQTKR